MQFCNMEKLNFPDYLFSLKSKENKPYIFDVIRKKWLVLTPEEWVRQHCVHFLINDKNHPASLIQVEKTIEVNQTKKRYDLIAYNKNKEVEILVECKSPAVAITQKTFDQIAQYNFTLKSKYLMITNGIKHYYCQMDFDKKSYTFLKELPQYMKK